MKNELYTMNQYGKITIDIKTFMDEKSINRNMLATPALKSSTNGTAGMWKKSMRMFLHVSALYWSVPREILSDTRKPTDSF